ncbi:MAG: hypothetical protein Ta2G_21430 [Termitinemataceae bacterium]|nr:MAG: hypothetical protein Ta2G_21430 [Termitinemataceae bacterium]
MSRSIHQTVAQVFYKKSIAEIDEMCNPEAVDFDVKELRKKRKIKKDVINERKSKKVMTYG